MLDPSFRPEVFSTNLSSLSRDDLLELPPSYLEAIATFEKYDIAGCVTRFELVDRILSRGAILEPLMENPEQQARLNICIVLCTLGLNKESLA